jgi:hypothetical protein
VETNKGLGNWLSPLVGITSLDVAQLSPATKLGDWLTRGGGLSSSATCRCASVFGTQLSVMAESLSKMQETKSVLVF